MESIGKEREKAREIFVVKKELCALFNLFYFFQKLHDH